MSLSATELASYLSLVLSRPLGRANGINKFSWSDGKASPSGISVSLQHVNVVQLRMAD